MTQAEPRLLCDNCGAPQSGRYCSSCGQQQDDPRQSIGRWVAKIVQDELSLDGRLPKTLAMLFRSPGGLTADWIAGRRARHIHPFRLYLMASIVLFSVTFVMGLPLGGLSIEMPGIGIGRTIREITTNAMAGQLQTMLTFGAMVMVPVFALWLRVILWRTEHLLVDHLVFSLHQHSALMLLLVVAWPILFVLPVWWSLLGVTLLAVVHAIVAYRVVYGRRRWIRRGLLAGGGWGLALVGLAFAIGFAVSQLIVAQGDTVVRDRAHGLYVDARRAPEALQDSAVALALDRLSLRWFDLVDGRYLLRHDSVHIAELRVDLGRLEASANLVEQLSHDYPDDITVAGLAMRWALLRSDTSAARGYARVVVRAGLPDSASFHRLRAEDYLAEARSLLGG